MAATAAAPAPAQPAEPATSPLAVDLRADLPVTLSAALLAGGLQLGREAIVGERCAPGCDEDGVNAVDRPFAGRYSAAAATASDVLVGLNLALPVALDGLELALGMHPDGPAGFGEDSLILAETLAVTIGLQSAVAITVQRPRPLTYGDGADLGARRSASAYLSFYSGHTSCSFAAATAYAYLFGVRHPRSPLRAGIWALGEGLAAIDGSLRVAAGYHFPTDVLVGAAVGTSVGLLVPWLHARRDDGTARAEGTAGRGTSAWLLVPAPLPGGFGVTLLAL
ncbi:MAG: phosphatase PAP2 family protein [Deltaproteobacteria bacterium]|nr:phosphatase PAP2 family protein [Deltaproteobacteria bacterium]